MTTLNPTFNLLVVDDNPTNLELMARIVENSLPEVRCLTARSAAEGFLYIKDERIDGAFIDVQMPAVNGFDMCRRLKGEPRTTHIPVVLLTAHIATPQSRAEGLDAGAQDFISQPVSNIEMLARIRVMLRLQRERANLSVQNQQLHQKLENNVAALRWLTGLIDADSNASIEPQLLEKLAAGLEGAQEPTPDQFANWLLPELPKDWQPALLKLALLETIPLELAWRLTKLENIETILDYLWRHNCHLEKIAGGYRFDESLHGYLREQALRLLSEDEQSEVQRLAADWYQEKKDFWSALRHLLQGRLFEEVELLLSQTGLLLPITAPKNATAMLELLPEDLAAKQGWLSLFVGSCKFLFAPDEVDSWLELARVRFVAARDRRGELLALAQKARQHLFIDGRLDFGRELLPRLQELLADQQDDLDPVNQSTILYSLALGLGFFVGDAAGGERAARSCLQLAQRSKLPALELEGRIACGYMAMLQGSSVVACSEIENAWQLGTEVTDSSLFLYLMAADLLLHTGEVDAYREQRRHLVERFGRQALKQGTLGAVLCLFDVEVCFLEGDSLAAAEMIQIGSVEGIAAANPHLQSWLLQFQALLHARSGRRQEARQDLNESRRLREQAGGGVHRLNNLMICAETLLELDEQEEAHELLQKALDLSCQSGDLLVRPGIHAMFARLYQSRAETARALDHLRDFLFLLRSHQHRCRTFLTPQLLEILPLAVENDVLPEVACRLSADILGCDISNDGLFVPHLQVSMLGPFCLQRAGGPLIEASSLGGPARHLLGLLTFTPGHQLSAEAIRERIWPDSSVDHARMNLDSALLRLRKALDDAYGRGAGRSYLAMDRGILSLRHVRIDVISFKAHVEQGRNFQRRGDTWHACHQLLAANKLWQGKFLEGFDLPEELLDKQKLIDDLRFEQIELLTGLSEPFCNAVDLEALLLQGLRADPIRESFIKRLLDIYRQQHDQVKQKRLLDRYRKALQVADFMESDIDEIVCSL
jgi:DNA-binding response OmpR family regulator